MFVVFGGVDVDLFKTNKADEITYGLPDREKNKILLCGKYYTLYICLYLKHHQNVFGRNSGKCAWASQDGM